MNKHLLVVDDDLDFFYLIKRYLSKDNQVDTFDHCNDGRQALDYFKKLFSNPASLDLKAPDLVYLDINMPDMSGFDFLEALTLLLRRQDENIIIPPPYFFVVTSSNSNEDKEKISQFKIISGFLTKPLNAKDINESLALVNLNKHNKE